MSFYVYLTADEMTGGLLTNYGANHWTLADNPRKGRILGSIAPRQANGEGQEIGYKLLSEKE